MVANVICEPLEVVCGLCHCVARRGISGMADKNSSNAYGDNAQVYNFQLNLPQQPHMLFLRGSCRNSNVPNK